VLKRDEVDILILDLTHGGDILAEEYAARGHSVTCADVYRLSTDEKRKELAGLGVNVTYEAVGEHDLVVMPAHCPDIFLDNVVFKDRITFSRAVR
jgi:2-polyprenyl-3-methyl-5-hydroxy-6-metoxy-1,4-benzoquinol methylase